MQAAMSWSAGFFIFLCPVPMLYQAAVPKVDLIIENPV